MTGTLAALAANPKPSHAEALQKSILAIIDDTQRPDWADPKHWAPFIVVGEAGKLIICRCDCPRLTVHLFCRVIPQRKNDARGTSRYLAAMQHFGRFWGEADINTQAKPAEAVENDPGCVKTAKTLFDRCG